MKERFMVWRTLHIPELPVSRCVSVLLETSAVQDETKVVKFIVGNKVFVEAHEIGDERQKPAERLKEAVREQAIRDAWNEVAATARSSMLGHQGGWAALA